MAKKEYAFYPGLLVAAEGVGVELPDVGQLDVQDARRQADRDPRLELLRRVDRLLRRRASCRGIAINARNFALAETHLPGQDIVATCAACWLGARETKERLDGSAQLMKETNEALAEAGLHYKGEVEIRHMVEVLIEDFGYDELKKPVVKPLEGVKFAGYVGCQTNRPFGIDGESFENPVYLDKLVETVGGEADRRRTTRRSPAAAARSRSPSRTRARSRSATSSNRPTTTAPR